MICFWFLQVQTKLWDNSHGKYQVGLLVLLTVNHFYQIINNKYKSNKKCFDVKVNSIYNMNEWLIKLVVYTSILYQVPLSDIITIIV